MTISVLRPSSDAYVGGEVVSTGANVWSVIDDGGAVPDFSGADDATYVRVNGGQQGFTVGRVIVGLTNLGAVASNQRIKQVRLRGKVRMNVSVPGHGATVTATFRDPQAGLGRGGRITAQVDAPRDEWFTTNPVAFQPRTGAWRLTPPQLDGAEWTKAILDRGQLEFVWYCSGDPGCTTNLRLSEAYVDVDVRTLATITGVTVAGHDATTRPTVSWVFNANADGDRQMSHRVKVFSAAQYSAAGFSPATSLATWDSAEQGGTATNLDVETDLVNGGTYKAYVRGSQDFNGGRWHTLWAASAAFTVALTPPPAPTLAVTSDPTVPSLRNALQFAATLNALTADDADFEGSVGNWIAGVGASPDQSTAQARHGTASMRYLSNGTANPFFTNSGNSGAGHVAVRPGQQFTLGGYTRAGTTGRAWYLVARYHFFNGTTDSYVDQDNGSPVTNNSSGWSTLPALAVTIPAGVNRLYVQLESATTPANGEAHYFDQLQVVPGPVLPAWAPGFLATSFVVFEYAHAHRLTRNLASPQLYGGGDATRDASGFYTTGANSQVAYDTSDRVRGIGSIRWDVEDATSKLYFGWPSGTLEDPAPEYALVAVPGRTYTFSVYARATTPFSSRIVLQAIDRAGATVGAAVNGAAVSIGTGWTRYAATITAPAGAVYVRPQLDNSASVTGRKVWTDADQWELGAAATGLVRGGGRALDWQPVRGFLLGKTPVPAGTQALLAFDHEVPPGITTLYRAWIFALDPASGTPLSSPLTAYFPTLIDPPGDGQWVLSEVGGAPLLRGRVHVLPSIAERQHEEATSYYPLRPVPDGQVGGRPVTLSDGVFGHDGTIQLAGLSDDDWLLLEDLLAKPDALWLTESHGGAKYVRLTDRGWGRQRFRDNCMTLADGTVLDAEEWERVLTLSYLHAERPPDNEQAVLFGVEPISGGVEEPPPPGGELVFPGAASNWIDSAGGCCNSASVISTGGVTHDFGGNAGCNTAGTPPRNPAGTFSQWTLGGTWRRCEWKLRIDDDDPAHGHFWALQAAFQGTSDAWYAGFQRNGTVGPVTGKLALFSVWGALSAAAGTASGAHAGPFTEGTSGYRVAAPYPWTLGSTYTLRVQADTARGVDWWRFDVVDDATGTLSYVGSVQVPTAWGDISSAAAVAFSEWFTFSAGEAGLATRPSGVFGGGFQNAGCFAPSGVGHQWLAVTGGDVGGFAVTTDGSIWKPANTNLLLRNKQRVSCVEGSRTTANRIYGWTSSNDGVGAGSAFLLRGTFQPASGLIDWVQVAAPTSGTQAGNVGDNHPRQVGRTMALDEANDRCALGSINGIAIVTGISGTGTVTNARALAGHHVTGIVLDPTDTNIAYVTVDDDGGAGQAGVWRVTNLFSGTVTTQRHSALTNPQDVQVATVAGTRYCWVAAMGQGIWRWQVGADITTGWTDLTGTLVTTQGYAGIDVHPGAALASTRVIATTADSAATAVDAGAYSADGGATWSRESQAWGVSTVPMGLSAPWWLEAIQPQALLNGNTYEAETPRFNPADPTQLHIHGRSGVWQSLDAAVNWRPSVHGQCVSGGIAIACDPTNTARAVAGDNDWTMFRSTDRFTGMPDPEEPGGVTGRSVFDFDFNAAGKLAIAAGAAPSNSLGEVYTTSDPWATTVTYTSQGFAAAGGGSRCRAVALGSDGTNEVLLVAVEGQGIFRKVGTGTPTLVSAAVTVSGTAGTRPKFCWPGHTGPNVYCSADNGLFRSTNFGATWTSIWSYTQAYDFSGALDVDPATPTTLYVTVDDNASNVGLYKVTSASTSPMMTRVGPAMDPPGQVAVDPATGRVHVTTTMDTSGGPKLYRSPIPDPTSSTTFEDLTDAQWAAGVMWPRDMAVAADGTTYVANSIGGYFVAAPSGQLTSCLLIPRATAYFGTPGFATTLGAVGGGTLPGAFAQPLLLGLHRPIGATAEPVCDPFTAADGSAPNPATWVRVLEGAAAVDVQGNQLSLRGDVGANEGSVALNRPAMGDQEFLGLVECGADSSWLLVLVRASNFSGAIPQDAYFLEYTGSDPPNAVPYLYRRVGGANTLLAVAGDGLGGMTPGERRWVRAQAFTVGGNVQLRVRQWAENTAEPATWSIDVTDSDPAKVLSGVPGLAVGDSGRYLLDEVCIHTAEQPSPPTGGDSFFDAY